MSPKLHGILWNLSVIIFEPPNMLQMDMYSHHRIGGPILAAAAACHPIMTILPAVPSSFVTTVNPRKSKLF